MEGFLGRYASYVYAIMRIVTGFLFMWHGTQKLLGFPPSASGGGELSATMAIGGGIAVAGIAIAWGMQFLVFDPRIAWSGVLAVGVGAYLAYQNLR